MQKAFPQSVDLVAKTTVVPDQQIHRRLPLIVGMELLLLVQKTTVHDLCLLVLLLVVVDVAEAFVVALVVIAPYVEDVGAIVVHFGCCNIHHCGGNHLNLSMI